MLAVWHYLSRLETTDGENTPGPGHQIVYEHVYVDGKADEATKRRRRIAEKNVGCCTFLARLAPVFLIFLRYPRHILSNSRSFLLNYIKYRCWSPSKFLPAFSIRWFVASTLRALTSSVTAWQLLRQRIPLAIDVRLWQCMRRYCLSFCFACLLFLNENWTGVTCVCNIVRNVCYNSVKREYHRCIFFFFFWETWRKAGLHPGSTLKN